MYKSYIEDIGIMLLRFLTLSKLNFIKYFTKFRVQMPDLGPAVSSLNASTLNASTLNVSTHIFARIFSNQLYVYVLG